MRTDDTPSPSIPAEATKIEEKKATRLSGVTKPSDKERADLWVVSTSFLNDFWFFKFFFLNGLK